MIQDDSFLTFEGEPVTGRVPTKLIVSGEQAIAPEQLAAVGRIYREFAQGQRVSLVRFATHYATLPDGTRVRIERNADQGDRVFVTPPDLGLRAIKIEGYAFLPADKDHTTGWNFSTIPDSARAFLPAPAKRVIGVMPPVELHVKINAGAVDWRGDKGVILSWDHGGNNRYDTAMWETVFYGSSGDNAVAGIYYKGTKINTAVGVSSCAIYNGFVVYIGHDGAMYSTPSPIGGINQSLAQGQFVKEFSPVWTGVTITGSVATARRGSAWHFKPDGSVAGAAYVDSSFGVGTWNLERMRTEAVTMMKRYLTLSIVSGAVQAAVSDTAYTCDPVAMYLNGSGTPQSGAVSVSGGSVTFGGKRLWGIDWAADGTEILITFERTGSGTAPDLNDLPTSTISSWDQYWSVKANGSEIFRASYFLPDVTISGSPLTYSQTGAGDFKAEFIAVHALDGRDKAAVFERLTMEQAGAMTFTGSSAISDNAVGMTSRLEVIFEGALVASHSEAMDSSLMPPLYVNLNCDFRYGPSFYRDATYAAVGHSLDYWLAYPQLGDYYTENIYEEIFRTSGAIDRSQHNVFASYPNQVSDSLQKLFWVYSFLIFTWDFSVLTSSVNNAYFGAWTGALTDSEVKDYFLGLGVRTNLERGLAIPMPAPLHFAVTAGDYFVNQFFDTMRKIQEGNAGTSRDGIVRTYFASLFTRPTTSDPWSDNDLLSPVESKVTTVDGAIDTATFHIDPLRVV